MWKRRRNKRRAQEPVPLELCDLCGTTFPADRAVTGYVPDSSAAHPTQDRYDGLRLITACSDPHFDAVREGYRHRPFVEEELWAAKLTRALTIGPSALSMEQLGCRTGLDEPQIRRAITWHNQHLRHRTDP
ncbi:hypothetical protein ACLGIH_32195 [Streptomyces sp. HMX87]|uniref:hypothetical protein n=1 Tax=Streptomyces sp. HMX87 TaxID=3390849 RepID=UPI003A87804A